MTARFKGVLIPIDEDIRVVQFEDDSRSIAAVIGAGVIEEVYLGFDMVLPRLPHLVAFGDGEGKVFRRPPNPFATLMHWGATGRVDDYIAGDVVLVNNAFAPGPVVDIPSPELLVTSIKLGVVQSSRQAQQVLSDLRAARDSF